MIARRKTEADDDRGLLSRVDAEVWLMRLGRELLVAQTHAAARLAFNTATKETANRLPYGIPDRALDLLEKRLRHLAEKGDRAHGAPP